MRLALLVILLLLLGSLTAHGDLSDGPDHTILWNKFTAVTMIDGYAVGLGPQALVVCRYDDTLLKFVPVNFVLENFEPVCFKRQDSLLMVKTSRDRIAFYSLNELPQLPHLGTIDPGIPVADYALNGNSIYLSSWFDGIWRFALDGYSSVEFVDSSRTGILMTQLEIDGDTLYALDRYNGIIRYDLSAPGFGRFLDYLWIPFRATSFLKTDSMVMIATVKTGVLFGEFGLSGPGIVDSIGGIDNPLRMFATDTLLIFLNDRYIDLVVRDDPTQRTSLPVGQNLIYGDLLILNIGTLLLLPHAVGGMTLFDLGKPGDTRSGLYPTGAISDLLLHHGKLFVGITAEPIGVHSFDSSALPELEYTILDNLTNPSAFEHNGDTLIALYAEPGKIAFIDDSSDPDSFHVERWLFTHDSSVADIRYFDQKIDSIRPLLALSGTRIHLFAMTDSSAIYHAATWQFLGRVAQALIKDSLLFVTTNKNQLWVYRITESFDIQYRSMRDLAGAPTELMVIDGRLVVFIRNDMLVFDYADPFVLELEEVITLAVPVLDAVRRNDTLYTVGPNGVGIYSLSGAEAVLVDFGGRGGSFLDVDTNVLVTSDGGSIHIYRVNNDVPPPPEPAPADFALSQNYPNPFNEVTSIKYALQTDATVEIVVYNILGQRVCVLVDQEKTAGEYTARWDGTDHSGGQVASGIYFYRLQVNNLVSSKKMLLLK